MPAVAERDLGERADRPDRGLDLGVGRRHDLRAGARGATEAGAEVDLVAVVLRRVVAGRDHHAGGRVASGRGRRASMAARRRVETCVTA